MWLNEIYVKLLTIKINGKTRRFDPASVIIKLVVKYIFLLFYFTTNLIMTEARLKRRVLPLIFIVK